MTLESYTDNPDALGCKVSGVQLYINTTLLSARERQRGGSVWADHTHGKCELSAVTNEKGRWRYRIAWPADQGKVL
jgi:hypothetical protein